MADNSKFVCGFFDSNVNVSTAIKNLRTIGIPKRQIHLFENPYEITQDGQDSMMSNPARGIMITAGIAAIGGGVIGALLAGPFDLFALSPGLAALVGALGGAAFGSLGGLIVGADVPSKQIQKMADTLEEGKKLLVIEVKKKSADVDATITTIKNSGGLYHAII